MEAETWGRPGPLGRLAGADEIHLGALSQRVVDVATDRRVLRVRMLGDHQEAPPGQRARDSIAEDLPQSGDTLLVVSGELGS